MVEKISLSSVVLRERKLGDDVFGNTASGFSKEVAVQFVHLWQR